MQQLGKYMIHLQKKIRNKACGINNIVNHVISRYFEHNVKSKIQEGQENLVDNLSHLNIESSAWYVLFKLKM
jgi:hypothetical protein